jgi:hypothetical protein
MVEFVVTILGNTVQNANVLVLYENDTLYGVTDNSGLVFFTLDIGYYLISVTAMGHFKTDGAFTVKSLDTFYVQVTIPVQGNVFSFTIIYGNVSNFYS